MVAVSSMHESLVRFTAASALFVCAVATILALSGTAGAASRPFRPIVCTAASQLTTQSPTLVTGCDRPRITGGSGDFQENGVNGNDVLTWATGKVFNVRRDSAISVSPSPCPSGTAEVDFRGTVLSTSGKGTFVFLGKKVSFDACLSVGLTIVVVEIVPGTSFTVG